MRNYRTGFALAAFALCLGLTFTSGRAAGPDSLALWPAGVPDNAIDHGTPETLTVEHGNRWVRKVGTPMMTFYPAPEETANGAAVLIFPGGGFRGLAIDYEGNDLARWLNSLGVAGIVVKYRLRTGDDDPDVQAAQMAAIYSDGRRAVRLARYNAERWKIDPARIGVMGFSAGGRMSVTTAAIFDAGDSLSADPVQRFSSRPDFACLIYPGVPREIAEMVSGEAPPMFLVNGADDQTTPADRCIQMYEVLQQAGVPSELHVFQKGSHGFGMGLKGGPVAQWPELFAAWMKDLGVLGGK